MKKILSVVGILAVLGTGAFASEDLITPFEVNLEGCKRIATGADFPQDGNEISDKTLNDRYEKKYGKFHSFMRRDFPVNSDMNDYFDKGKFGTNVAYGNNFRTKEDESNSKSNFKAVNYLTFMNVYKIFMYKVIKLKIGDNNYTQNWYRLTAKDFYFAFIEMLGPQSADFYFKEVKKGKTEILSPKNLVENFLLSDRIGSHRILFNRFSYILVTPNLADHSHESYFVLHSDPSFVQHSYNNTLLYMQYFVSDQDKGYKLVDGKKVRTVQGMCNELFEKEKKEGGKK